MKYWFVLGPTSSGKTALALYLARHVVKKRPVALLALDAMQVYCGADIGTGKPTASERAEFPHGGLDLVQLGQPFTVADYLLHVRHFLRDHADHLVLIVGGTGLYFRALTQGLCLASEAPPELRRELNALSLTELQDRLRDRDPAIWTRLDLQNPRRVIRALEVKESTGRSLLEWQAETPPPLIPEYTALYLKRQRGDLYRRISQRVEEMFQQGWVDEVSSLIQAHGREALLNFAAIGYEKIALQAGTQLEPSLKAEIVQLTQQYAKRQLTWFARELSLTPVEIAADFKIDGNVFNLTQLAPLY